MITAEETKKALIKKQKLHNFVKQLHNNCLTYFEQEEQKSESFIQFVQVTVAWISSVIFELEVK